MFDFDRLILGAEGLGISLTNKQLRQFERYQSLLLEWNQRINLTAIQDIEQIQTRHFFDSLTCSIAMGDLNGQTMIDVGTGAGFPGIPLKICFPKLRLTLLESVLKKTRFLKDVVEVLSLTDVTVYADRAEDLGQSPNHRETYDWAVARAVAPLNILSEYLLPLVHIHGYAIAQKGISAGKELPLAAQAISLLGGGSVELIPVNINGQEQLAHLVKIQKVNATPDKYPRRAGVPAKRPL